MTDVSYLERMGRELKCPICLSLLNSAVSLTCNHVFCNSCIGKSMKSASECPVCKVPYQRREIRPAPHMDNLVSIYKSMEIASGVNIFVTQPVPSTQLSGGEPPLDGSMICERDENKKNNRGKSKRKTSNLSLKNNSKTSSTNPLKPSFPRKKRVQVQQHPPLETPTRPTKLDGRIIEQTKDKAGDSSLVAKDRNNLNVNGETLFFPFFWLRDQKDTEKSSQRTDEDQVAETPPDAPCFSDMKDSDDDNHYDIAPQSAFHPVSHDPEILDSEMFKWTQRACSPELCCSPMKMQEMDCEVSLQDADSDSLPTVPNGGDKILENGNDELGVSISTVSAHGVKMTNNKSKTKTAKKRASKASGSTQRKRVKTVTDEVCGIPNEIQKGACSSIQANKCDDKGNQMNMKEMHCKRNKKVSFNTLSNEAIIIQVMDQSDRSNLEKGKNVNHNLKLTGQKKGTTDSTVPQVRDKSAKSKSQNPGNSNDGTSQLKTKTFTSQITRKSFLLDDDMKLPSSCQKKKESNVKSLKALNDSEEVKFAADCRSKVKVVNNIQRKVQENSSLGVENDSAEIVKAPARSSAMFLRKCEAASSIPCAFCQCPEDSNVSGVMVHYLKGKPVAADQSGGLGIIHAHRECAEWAPNVYFEDDTAINLETELSRSRRIKCCCCGLKGTALGCYAKSCHRSFHYPCAKLTPQCRWDNENFVMLCPLHAALVLPKEASGSQLKQEKKRMSKRQSHIPQAQVAIIHDNSTASRWNSHGLFKKMVISYSALSSEDKKTVAVFEKLSGVSVLKCWNSSVTHIITSTDENGASRRTLKFLMGILEGKWIINIDWVKACMKAMKPVDEQDYEIDVDIHGVREGPRFGRLRLLNKQPKLFSGLTFYFTGDFVPSYKGYLHDLVIAAGGTVLHRKPVPKDHDAQLTPGRVTSETLLIYSLELPDNCSPSKRKLILSHTQSDAEALARSSGAVAVSNSWILDSIAACKLQNLTE